MLRNLWNSRELSEMVLQPPTPQQLPFRSNQGPHFGIPFFCSSLRIRGVPAIFGHLNAPTTRCFFRFSSFSRPSRHPSPFHQLPLCTVICAVQEPTTRDCTIHLHKHMQKAAKGFGCDPFPDLPSARSGDD